jgi:uncharacterized membrane protein
MTTPIWVLTLAYWLHMLATVIWIGGLATLTILILPAAHTALDVPAYAKLVGELGRRLDPVGWFSLALLVGTGLLQMSANPNYHGFLAIQGRWASAIFFKHLSFLGMVGVSSYLTWGLLPRIRRNALRQAGRRVTDDAGAGESQQWIQEASRLQRQEATLLRINLALGILILALTAVARAA